VTWKQSISKSTKSQLATCYNIYKLKWMFPIERNYVNIVMCVTYRRVVGWMIGFIDTLYIHNAGVQAIQRYHWYSHFTVHRCTRIRILVFIRRIPATDLSLSRCYFTSYMKFSFHNLIPFLPLFCNCHLNSITLLTSSYPGRLASRNSSKSIQSVLYYDRRSVG
jgi:hypothetical protein